MKKTSKLNKINALTSTIKRNTLSLVLFALALMVGGANEAQAQVVNAKTPEVSLKVENSPITSLLTQIERLSGFATTYPAELKEDLKKRVSITVYRVQVEDILDKAFVGTELAYVINEDGIVLSRKPKTAAADSLKTAVVKAAETTTKKE